MEVCKLCGRYKLSSSCIRFRIKIKKTLYRPIPWEKKEDKEGFSLRCPSCGVLPGGYHHIGCLLEICPACYKPWLSCFCLGVKLPLKAIKNRREAELIAFPKNYIKGIKP